MKLLYPFHGPVKRSATLPTFSTDWKWDNDVKLDQELQVGEPITATAVYNGNDKGNYEKESIIYNNHQKGMRTQKYSWTLLFLSILYFQWI